MNIQPNLEHQINKLRDPFVAFISAQTTDSGFLLIVLLASLILANSPWAEAYERLQHFHIGLIFGDERVSWPLLHFVNDGLIAVFFFLIGLEV
jgi:NhaA family Na+:H+ antiporter